MHDFGQISQKGVFYGRFLIVVLNKCLFEGNNYKKNLNARASLFFTKPSKFSSVQTIIIISRLYSGLKIGILAS